MQSNLQGGRSVGHRNGFSRSDGLGELGLESSHLGALGQPPAAKDSQHRRLLVGSDVRGGYGDEIWWVRVHSEHSPT